MMKRLEDDGYVISEIVSANEAHIEAQKDGQIWQVVAPTHLKAVSEFMEQLSWDLMDR